MTHNLITRNSTISDTTMTDYTDYIPIDCAEYSRYELAIMRRQWLRLAWRDLDGAPYLEAVQPLDLQTRNKAEFLLARSRSGKQLKLRLDQIIRAVPYQNE